MKRFYRHISLTSLFGVFAIAAAACGGGGGGGGNNEPVAQVPPTPFPTSTPVASLTCLSAPPVLASVGLGTSAFTRRAASHTADPGLVPDEIAVHYQRTALTPQSPVRTMENAANARLVNEIDLAGGNRIIRVLRVDPHQVAAAMTRFQGKPGVITVSRVRYRSLQTATAYTPSDPYFAEPPTSTDPTPPGPPLFETSTVPGQWDMHIIKVANAWGYSQSGNTLGRTVPNALGSPSVKIAIVDTGADNGHPDLSGKIVRGGCFINGTATSDYTDFDGHGTNVSGIAAAALNGFGFVGVGGNVSLMEYRIFPSGDNSSASSTDEALAINDAVANGANVISLSLGAPGPDPTEKAAIDNALAHNVTVVAASGNGNSSGVGQSGLNYPAGYTGVIAVGASAIDDSGSTIVEHVASYSNYVAASTTWGLVAPGGDPSGGTDNDDLHWIENDYSRFATQAKCPNPVPADFFGEPNDCRIQIAGTSQATPHVAGAAALLISVSPGLTPGQVLQRLESTADNIGDAKQGAGRLNVYRAMATTLHDPTPP